MLVKSNTKNLLRKVPEVTAVFWVAKLFTTAMGEATSDFFANTFNPYVVVAVGAIVLSIALALQFKTKQYVAWVYWFAVAMVAVFGTMAADVLHKQFGIAYPVSTTLLVIALASVFTVWYSVEKSLSIHTINTPRREVFYWATVMATFALGTAAGDWTAYSLGLGYLTSGIIFTAIICIPIFGRLLKQNEIVVFWFAYIITRPIGASFADWFGKPTTATGLGYGDGVTSVVLAFLLVVTVTYMTLNRKERKQEIDPRLS